MLFQCTEGPTSSSTLQSDEVLGNDRMVEGNVLPDQESLDKRNNASDLATCSRQ